MACSDDDGDGAADGDDATTTAAVTDTTTTAAEATTTAAPDTATTQAAAGGLPEGYEDHSSDIYADPANWLCLPGAVDDVCARDLDATAVHADGTTEVQPHEVAADPDFDCFYVYPTISQDEGANSDLVPAEGEEIATVLNQAARFTRECRVFAPVYRQRTLTALGEGESDPETRDLAYDDVVDAFRHYIANHNDGRPFVLMGHSQGAGLLAALVGEEIDGEPALADDMVSALLIGASIAPDQFDEVPMCASATDTGCVVTYVSFRDTAPPPESSFFGRADDAPAACVNPVDPAGGAATVQPYFWMDPISLIGGGAQPFADPARSSEITTPFVTYPDFITVECAETDTHRYLELRIQADPSDPRTDDIGGDLTPDWGMHLVDVNVAIGDLVDLVASQAGSMGS